MKKLPLNNIGYAYLEQAFKEWLDILGYAKGTVYNLPRAIREFLYYLDTQNIKHISHLQTKHLQNYQNHLKTRPNQTKGGALSNVHINHHFWALEKFLVFLHHKGVKRLPDANVKYLKIEKYTREILTEDEIKELYKIAKEQEYKSPKQEALNYQDLVLLTVYYACGLRRNEGLQINLEDINLDTKILHVKKGKGGKQRLIPFNKTASTYLRDWIYQYRTVLVNDKKESKLFINRYGTSVSGTTLSRRLKGLIEQSQNTTLKEKQITLHSLRHSIATHLLANGMNIQKVQQFLGHKSLDTTAIYTHLVN